MSVVEDYLMHYGMPRRSGRYPWGSGDDPYQHGGRDFLSRVEELKGSGWTETPENIKEAFGLTTTQYRIEKSLCKDQRRMYQVATAKSLKEDGKGATEIGKIMGINESTVRSLLDDKSEARMKQAIETANFIKKNIDEKGMIDVGTGVERELNISKEKLNTALYLLEREGYPVYKGGIPQATNPGQHGIVPQHPGRRGERDRARAFPRTRSYHALRRRPPLRNRCNDSPRRGQYRS